MTHTNHHREFQPANKVANILPGLSLRQVVHGFILLILLILLRTAWIADDAFLTMRTVDNFVNGYGLRWNVLERVQIYTHPMWAFLLSACYYFVRDPFIVFYGLTLFLSMVVIYIFGMKFATAPARAVVGFSILVFSKSFIDYSTSGLENPLSHLLIIIFLYIFLEKDHGLKASFWLVFIASLMAFNRMDTLLILVPVLGFILYKNKSIKMLLYAGLGFLPFLLWELFSLLYYGFPFPNTAYAKLGTGISDLLLMQQGLRYAVDSIQRDPVTLFTISLSVLLAFKSRNVHCILMAAGIILYFLYVIKIGGDFMSGRYFSILLLVAAVVILRTMSGQFSRNNLILLGLIITLGLLTSNPDLRNHSTEHADIRNYGITDERIVYFRSLALINIDWKTRQPDHIWAQQGLEHKAKDRELSIGPASGLFAFYAGPTIHIVDTHGLGDPLLARLPAVHRSDFIIGHFFRDVPEGYWKFKRSFGNQIQDENLREYYEKLSILIHKEDLFSKERLLMIWRFNTGYYDTLLDAYMADSNKP
jgi:arabinofuranosyltransferase